VIFTDIQKRIDALFKELECSVIGLNVNYMHDPSPVHSLGQYQPVSISTNNVTAQIVIKVITDDEDLARIMTSYADCCNYQLHCETVYLDIVFYGHDFERRFSQFEEVTKEYSWSRFSDQFEKELEDIIAD
jgi:hypothetical protein